MNGRNYTPFIQNGLWFLIQFLSFYGVFTLRKREDWGDWQLEIGD